MIAKTMPILGQFDLHLRRISARFNHECHSPTKSLMVARAGEAIVFLQAVSQGNRTRATMKAINAAPNLSSTTLAPTDGPASCLTCRLRVMPMRADQSAMCTINRHLLWGWMMLFIC